MENRTLLNLEWFGAVPGVWGKLTYQPRSLISISWNQSWKVETVFLKWVITKVKIPNIEFHEHRDPAVRTVNFITPHDFDPGLGLFILIH
jgi:hypothetical protein